MIIRECNVTLFQFLFHPEVFLQLFFCKCLIFFIGFGKMRKHTFHYQIRQLADSGDLICIFLRNLETKSCHSCIKLNMNIDVTSHSFGKLRYFFCHLIAVNGHTYLVTDHYIPLIRENASQYQYWLFQACILDQYRLVQCGNGISPDVIHRLQKFCDLDSSVPITIHFDNCHHLGILMNIFFHHFYIIFNRI